MLIFAHQQIECEPIAGLQLRISPQDDQIQLRSPTLFDGYWPPGPGALPLTADGWFGTGDLGRLDAAGRLHVLARRTDLIVTGGENVYPVEVEQALERCAAVTAGARSARAIASSKLRAGAAAVGGAASPAALPSSSSSPALQRKPLYRMLKG